MPAPLIAAGLKYLAGQGLQKIGLPSGLVDPKGYAIGQVSSAIDRQTGLPAGTTAAVVNPVGAAKQAVKNAVVNAAKGAVLNQSSWGTQPEESYDDELKAGNAKGGLIKSKGKSASRRGDGIAQRGKTKGRMR